MHFQTWVVLSFFSATAAATVHNAKDHLRALQLLPKLEANCETTTANSTSKCCAVFDWFGEKSVCVVYTFTTTKPSVDVTFIFNGGFLGSFHIDSKPIPTCYDLSIASAQLCVAVTEFSFNEGTTKLCSAIQVRVLGFTAYQIPIPCIQYKDKWFSIGFGK